MKIPQNTPSENYTTKLRKVHLPSAVSHGGWNNWLHSAFLLGLY